MNRGEGRGRDLELGQDWKRNRDQGQDLDQSRGEDWGRSQNQVQDAVKGCDRCRVDRVPAGLLSIGIAMICFLALYYMILFATADLQIGSAGLIQLRLKNAAISGRDVERMIRDKNENAEEGLAVHTGSASEAQEAASQAAPLYTAWTEAGGVEIENQELDRRVSSNIIYYCGDNNLYFDLTQDMGCAVSAELAFQLWGTRREEEVAGCDLLIGGREFIVEKVLPSGGWMEQWSGSAVIARVDSAAAEAGESNQSTGGMDSEQGKEIRFDVLDVSVLDENGVDASGKSQAFSIDSVIMEGGLKPSTVIHYGQLLAALNALHGLPVWGAALCAAVPLLIRARRYYKEIKLRKPECDMPMSFLERLRENRLQVMRRVFPFAALGSGLILLTAATVGAPFIVTDSFIPTRWSDFSFWTSALTEAGQSVRVFLTMELYGPDIWFRKLALQIIAGCFGQTVLVLWAIPAALMGIDRTHRFSRLLKI